MSAPPGKASVSADGVELSTGELHRLADEVARRVADRIAKPDARVFSGAGRAELDALLLAEPPELPRGPDALLSAISDGLFVHAREYRHPLHFGHQRPAPLAAAAFADLAVSALNPGSQTYEASPFAVALEKRVLGWMARLAGFPEDCAATFSSGGTESNLTALLCAREALALRVGEDDRPRLVFTSEEAHYSIARAAHVLGLGERAVVRVACDRRLGLDPVALARAIDSARARGAAPMAVVCAAGSTGCGSFDDLVACGRVARASGAWFHVDGAHGASLLLSPSLRSKLAGCAEADSLSWNAHKMFWVAPPCGVLLVRRRRDLAYALAPGLAEASYVVPDQAALARLDADEDDLLHWTLATTRLCMGLKIYAALAVYGLSGLRHRIERLCELSRALHRLVSESPDFAALVEPEANIVCFRHRPPALAGDEPAIDVHNRRLRQAIARGPATYLTGVAIGGRYWLRATLMNENITAASLPALLAIVRETALSLTT